MLLRFTTTFEGIAKLASFNQLHQAKKHCLRFSCYRLNELLEQFRLLG